MKKLRFIGDFFDLIFASVSARDRILLVSQAGGALLNLLMWLLIALNWSTLVQPDRPYIVLHYKVNFGPDFYSEWYSIFLVPITGLLFLVLNGIFARRMYLYVRSISYALALTAAACQFFLILATYFIIQINVF
jgi:hypothetical protein